MAEIKGQSNNSGRNAIEPVQDNIVYLSTFVNIPPDKAFSYFISNNLLQSWLTNVAEVEPFVGGKYELFWQPEDRENNSTIGCRVTAFKSFQLIAFQWRSPKQFKSFANAADPLTHVVVSFVPVDSGTQIHLIHSGWRSGLEWEEARVWQEKAWMNAFNQLKSILNDLEQG